MKKKLGLMVGGTALLAALGSWFFSGCIGAGPVSSVVSGGASRFPGVTGVDLTGREVNVPGALTGERRLLAVAFLHEQQRDINTWVERLGEMKGKAPDLTFYELPVIEKGSALFRMWVNNGMRAGIPDEGTRRSTITVYTDVSSFLTAVDAPDVREIQVFLLDRDGTILGRARGPYSAEKAASLFGEPVAGGVSRL